MGSEMCIRDRVYLTRENAENKKQVLENLDKIDLSAHFMLSFVDDILNLSQIESGNVALNLEDTDFLKFIDKLKTSVEELAEEKGVSLYTKMRGELDDEYCFDAEKLEKAMHNILFNAVKYTSAGGRVDFITEVVHTEEKKTFIRFEIRDTGAGMDETFVKRVFEPFEQEDDGSTTLSGGTGLGLSVARNIIEFMEGRIDVYLSLIHI